MSYIRRESLTLTTDGSGAAEGYISTGGNGGFLEKIAYVKTDFADGVDFTITEEDTGQGLWTESDVNASKVVAPRLPTHDLVGAAALFADAGEAVVDKIPVVGRIKVVIAQGGDTKTGTFHAYIS